jgi:hypothetical protein
MTHRFTIVLTLCYWLLVFSILSLTYQFTDYREGLMTAEQMAIVYAEMTTVIWIAGIGIWWIVRLLLGSRPVLAGCAAFALSASVLCAYGIFEFRAPIALRRSVTPELVGAHFFRDYMPLVFSWVIGPLCALILGVIVVVHARSESSLMPTKKG